MVRDSSSLFTSCLEDSNTSAAEDEGLAAGRNDPAATVPEMAESQRAKTPERELVLVPRRMFYSPASILVAGIEIRCILKKGFQL